MADTGSIGTGPLALVEQLRHWAESTSWCDWVELAGSLGRGAGDELSDVDAGAGIDCDHDAFESRRGEIVTALQGFASVADTLIQSLGTDDRPADHLIIQYDDGRQFSLVVMPAPHRPGLPPDAVAVVDKSGRLAHPMHPDSFHATAGQLREWSFLAWLGLGDAAKHAHRGTIWRSLGSLTTARDEAWKLYAASQHVGYPGFGAVSVENAGLPVPRGMSDTHPENLTVDALAVSISALIRILEELTEPHDVAGIRTATIRRLRELLP